MYTTLILYILFCGPLKVVVTDVPLVIFPKYYVSIIRGNSLKKKAKYTYYYTYKLGLPNQIDSTS